MATVEQTTMKVQRLLTGPMALKVTLEGESFHVRFKDASTAVNLKVKDWGTHEGEPETLIHIWATVLRDVPPTPELFEWVAREGGRTWFGHVEVVADRDNPAAVMLAMTHALLGDYVDQRELETAMMGVMLSADKVDDELQKRFGGKRWIDS